MTDHDERLPGGVTLEGWQTDPQLRWSFQHVADLFPTAAIHPSERPTSLTSAPEPLGAVTFVDPTSGHRRTVDDLVEGTQTDGWLVLHRGVVVDERYPRGMDSASPHLLMSVSKSVVGIVTSCLVDQGFVSVQDEVTRHVPELRSSGYAGARVRDLLDMRSGVRFSEVYTDPDAEVRQLEQAIGWAPRRSTSIPDNLYGFLATLQRERPHGGSFLYRSCETDVLGWLCERASGRSMARLVTELVWQPMGARHPANLAVDRLGGGMHDGGISATLRDVAVFGSLFVADGTAPNGTHVVNPRWIADTLAGAHDSAAAFAASPDSLWMPGGMYRNQVWFPSAQRDILACLGIHGQLVYVDRTRQLVVAKLSGWPHAQDAGKLLATLAACEAIAQALG